MDKEEISQIKKAIYLLHNKNEYYEGMNILARLVGLPVVKTPSKSISVKTLLQQANSADAEKCPDCNNDLNENDECPHWYSAPLISGVMQHKVKGFCKYGH